jgi:hypothetical protein
MYSGYSRSSYRLESWMVWSIIFICLLLIVLLNIVTKMMPKMYICYYQLFSVIWLGKTVLFRVQNYPFWVMMGTMLLWMHLTTLSPIFSNWRDRIFFRLKIGTRKTAIFWTDWLPNRFAQTGRFDNRLWSYYVSKPFGRKLISTRVHLAEVSILPSSDSYSLYPWK